MAFLIPTDALFGRYNGDQSRQGVDHSCDQPTLTPLESSLNAGLDKLKD